MDETAFTTFLRRGGRSPNAAGRVLGYVQDFEAYLAGHGLALDDAGPADLESYVASIESVPGATAKLDLWGILYYYDFLDDVVMVHAAAALRRERVEKTPFPLRQFRGVNAAHTDRLAAEGIRFAVTSKKRAGHRRRGRRSPTVPGCHPPPSRSSSASRTWPGSRA